MFKAEIQNILFKKVIDTLSNINSDIIFFIDKDVMLIQCINEGSALNVLCESKLFKNTFTTYSIKEPIKKSINTNGLKKLLSILDNNDNLKMICSDDTFDFSCGRYTRKIKYLYSDDIKKLTMPDEREDEKRLVFDYSIKLSAKELTNSLLLGKDVLDETLFNMNNKKLNIVSKTNLDEAHVIFDESVMNIIDLKGKGDLNSIYQTDFLYDYISKIDGNIELSSGNNLPMCIVSRLGNHIIIKYIIAPRILRDNL